MCIFIRIDIYLIPSNFQGGIFMKLKQKLWLVAITVMLLTLLFALCASAETVTGDCSKSTSDSVSWSFDTETGTLTISGTGAMANYTTVDARPWHSYASSINTIVVEEGVTAIGQRAFRETAVTSISFPSTLVYIYDYAIVSCTNLTSVRFAEGHGSLEYIYQQAFTGCSKLTSIALPDGAPTHINKRAFNNCSTLRSVRLGDSTVSVGTTAFNNCPKLTRIVVPASVQTFGTADGAGLSGTTAPAHVYFLGSNTTILPASEAGIPTSAKIHAPVGSKAEKYATDNNRTFVDANSTVASGTAGDTISWTFSGLGVLTVSGTGSIPNQTNGAQPWAAYNSEITAIVIGEGITAIGNNVFRGSSVGSVSFSSTVTSTANQVFCDCTMLTEVNFAPNSKLKTIGYMSFINCSLLEKIVLPDGVATTIGTQAFQACSKLYSVVLGNQTTAIGRNAFSNCTALKSIVIPASVKTCGVEGGSAFAGCTSLTKIVFRGNETQILPNNADGLPASATIYGAKDSTAQAYATAQNRTFLVEILPSGTCGTSLNWVFDPEFGRLTITGTGATTNYTTANEAPWHSFAGQITQIVLPEGITVLGDRLFNDCGVLTIEIPASVTAINQYAFRQCKRLTKVTFAEGSKLNAVGYMVFNTCSKLQSVVFPNETSTTLAGFVFNNCSALRSVTLGNKTTSIAGACFKNCYALTSVEIPALVATCGGTSNGVLTSAFDGCSALTEVTFYNPTTNIIGTFPTSKTITLYGFSGSTADTVANASADDNVSFKAITGGSGNCGKTASDNVTWTFDAATGELTISGTGAMADYTEAPQQPWHNFRAVIKTITVEEGITSVGKRTFRDSSVVNVTLPASLVTLSDSAFNSCLKLISVSFPEGNGALTTVQTYVFSGSTNLKSINFPHGTPTTLGVGTFNNCYALTSVILGNGTVSISGQAFNNCKMLKDLVIPASVTTCGVSSFVLSGNCDPLTKVTFLGSDTSIGGTLPAGLKTIVGFKGSTAEALATDGVAFVALATDVTSAFELTATYTPDAEKAGQYIPVATFTRTDANGSVAVDLLYVEGATGELYIKSIDGTHLPFHDEEGTAIALGTEETAIAIIYDDVKGVARYYVDGVIPFVGEDNTMAYLLPVHDDTFASTVATKDVLTTLADVYVDNVYNANASATAEWVGLQVSDDSKSIRILAGLDMLYYGQVGFEIELYSADVLQGSVNSAATTVFSSIVADGETVTAASEGHRYLTAIRITDIYPGNFTNPYFIVKTYTSINGDKVYGAAKKITITYENEKNVYTIEDAPVEN